MSATRTALVINGIVCAIIATVFIFGIWYGSLPTKNPSIVLLCIASVVFAFSFFKDLPDPQMGMGDVLATVTTIVILGWSILEIYEIWHFIDWIR